MKGIPGLKQLCTPAIVYLILSVVTLLVMYIQNLGDPTSYCIGRYSCNVNSVNMLFVIKVIYVLFWTWILNILCREGFEVISWIFVLLPYLLMFIFIASLFLYK